MEVVDEFEEEEKDEPGVLGINSSCVKVPSIEADASVESISSPSSFPEVLPALEEALV